MANAISAGTYSKISLKGLGRLGSTVGSAFENVVDCRIAPGESAMRAQLAPGKDRIRSKDDDEEILLANNHT